MPWLKKESVPQWLFSTNTLPMRMEGELARYYVSDIHVEGDLGKHSNLLTLVRWITLAPLASAPISAKIVEENE